MIIEIETDSDTHDCEACGGSWASGGFAIIDGVEILDLPASAHCFNGDDYSQSDLLVMALAKVGITVNVDGRKWYVCSHNDDYHGKMEDR